ncbi:MAG: T9SS type A sorting domain-containing protein [Flavobacteriia bacterium]|nr:T9SS type A sorting domain-containing protein [Flavobacteriia bacterium]
MKKLLFLFLLTNQVCFAQNDSIFPNLRGEWEQQYYFYDNDPTNYFIGKLITRKLDENYDTMGLYSFVSDQNPEGLLIAKLYSDTLKVYVKKATEEQFIDNFDISFLSTLGNDYEVLYDFSLEINDTAYFSYFHNAFLTVTNIEYLNINNELRKKIKIGDGLDIWIQGLGSINHPIYPVINFIDYCEICRPSICSSLMEYNGISSVDTYLYESTFLNCYSISIHENELKFIKIYPNPINENILIIDFDKKIDYFSIYNLQNKKIQYDLPLKSYNKSINELDLKNLPAGFYNLEIVFEGNNIKRKIIKL